MERLFPLLLLLLAFTSSPALARKLTHIIYKGGIVRADTTRRQLTLVFTAADKNDGVEQILRTLKAHHIKGAFFVTGSFLKRFPEDVARIRRAIATRSTALGTTPTAPSSPVRSLNQTSD